MAAEKKMKKKRPNKGSNYPRLCSKYPGDTTRWEYWYLEELRRRREHRFVTKLAMEEKDDYQDERNG